MSGWPRAILFDLFGTLVFFDDQRLLRQKVGGGRFPSTVPNLEQILVRLEPAIEAERFLRALETTSRELAREKAATHVEVPSLERFRRALVTLDLHGDIEEAAAEMSARHMSSLSEAVDYRGDRPTLLRTLGRQYRLGLVSNFDHGPTARRILARAGIVDLFESVVISEEVGVRKPGAAIFSRALEELGERPDRCLYVGDDYEADIAGATTVGLPAVWIDRSERPPAPALGKLADVEGLVEWLAVAPDVS